MGVFVTGAGIIPASRKLLSDFSVGESVFLNENGKPVEYLIVNQGIPSSLYDSSCNGTWLLRKDIYDLQQWGSASSKNNYGISTVHTYLNSTFFNLFEKNLQSAIQQVKIPYVNGVGNVEVVSSGSNGLSAKIFLLSGYELGWSLSHTTQLQIDGARLSYFLDGITSNAITKRVAYYNGIATEWWLRSAFIGNDMSVRYVDTSGGGTYKYYNQTYGVRPALVLPFNAAFDEETLLFKGVK